MIARRICQNTWFHIGETSSIDKIPIDIAPTLYDLESETEDKDRLMDLMELYGYIQTIDDSLYILEDKDRNVLCMSTTVKCFDTPIRVEVPIVIYNRTILNWNLFARSMHGTRTGQRCSYPHIIVSWDSLPMIPIPGWFAQYAWCAIESE